MTNSSHKRAAKSGWGGKRAGAGRKPDPDASVSKVTTVVLTEDLIAKLRELGGSKWVREQIQKSGTEKNFQSRFSAVFFRKYLIGFK